LQRGKKVGSPNLTGRRRRARKSRSDPRKRGHSRERPSSRRVMGHRCRHNADASLHFRMIEPWQRVLIQLESCLRVSLVRQLARSAWREISPRRRRCAVVFVGRREPINHAPGERRSIFGRRRSLSTKLNRNGKPPRLSSSVSVSPSHAQHGISGVRRQPP